VRAVAETAGVAAAPGVLAVLSAFAPAQPLRAGSRRARRSGLRMPRGREATRVA
jgi:hypothetical protein